MDKLDIITIVAFTIGITGLLMIFMQFIKRRLELDRTKRYDFEKRIAKLEYIRQNYEDELYEINKKMMNNEARWKDINHMIISNQDKVQHFDEETYPIKLNQFLINYGIKEQDIKIDDNLVFLLTPFNEVMNRTYKIITEVCTDVGLRCLRGDEQFIEGEIFPSILRNIIKARLVIANIDGRNPNVFYELGIAHALDKPVIIISKNNFENPFDLKTKQILIYQDDRELNTRLRLALTRVFMTERK